MATATGAALLAKVANWRRSQISVGQISCMFLLLVSNILNGSIISSHGRAIMKLSPSPQPAAGGASTNAMIGAASEQRATAGLS
jgi:hypothetical protein